MTGQVPEFKTAPIDISFHLLAEFVTAVALICGGLWVVLKRNWGKRICPSPWGVLAYTLMATPGRLIENHVWPPVVIFAVPFLLALASLTLILRAE